MKYSRVIVDIPADAACPMVGRNIVRTVLSACGMADQVDDALIVTTELITNAVVHASRPGDVVELEVLRIDEGVRITVTDRSARMPLIAHIDPEGATGHGLRIVDALSTAWGSDQQAKGKRVWAELSCTAPY